MPLGRVSDENRMGEEKRGHFTLGGAGGQRPRDGVGSGRRADDCNRTRRLCERPRRRESRSSERFGAGNGI